MKITRKNLMEWIDSQLIIRYHGELYRASFNGRQYALRGVEGDSYIPFYLKAREKGKQYIYGLETNKA